MSNSAVTFDELALDGWRQFDEVKLRFHPHLTVVTGANGAGKTTILNLLSQHFGWHQQIVSTPLRDRISGGLRQYFADVWRLLRAPDRGRPQQSVGRLRYSNNTETEIFVPETVSQTYVAQFTAPQNVQGIFIPSHRPISSPQSVTSIPTTPKSRREMFDSYSSLIKGRYLNQHTLTPAYSIKENLIALAIFGPGNESIESNNAAFQTFRAFEAVLAMVLPPKLGFMNLQVRLPDVVLVTRSGDFSLDAVSGGIASIIDITWQIFMYAPVDGSRFVVLFDEPENHLHPELQLTLLPNLVAAFPGAQFIIASHNPLIVTSTPESSVVALDYTGEHKVIAKALDFIDKSGSANEILRTVLGLPFSMPLWVADRLDGIVDEFSSAPLSDVTLSELRQRLGDIGMARYVPETLAAVLRASNVSGAE